MRELLKTTLTLSEDDRYIYATAICICMDNKICYEESPYEAEVIGENGQINLHSLIPVKITDRSPILLDELNSNFKNTKICIAPKFPVSGVVIPEDQEKNTRSLAARYAYYGINGKLNNVCYYPLEDTTPKVHHIIFPESLSKDNNYHVSDVTTVVFSPLSDRNDLIELGKPEPRTIYDISYIGRALDHLNDEVYIENHFKDTWLSACECSPDIVFFPEMLATDKMVKIDNNGSVFLKPLINLNP